MTGEPEATSRCPMCGGSLKSKVTTIPFVFQETVVIVKDVPAEVCTSCHEPYTPGWVTDQLTTLLEQLRAFRTEVSIISYNDTPTFPAKSKV